jgi:homocysteine S-methyltransferase
MRLIDGGLSTELERIGTQFHGELWTGHALLDNEASVQAAHRNFVDSGAEVVTSASYQLSRQGFQEIGLTPDEADRALQASIEIARAAVAQSACMVAASVGPYGAVLHDGSEYRGQYEVSQAQLEDFHFERIEVLLASKPDLLAVETIPNVLETKALANVLKNFAIPFWFSFTASSESTMWSGENIQEAAGVISGLENLVAAGVNCVDAKHVAALTKSIHSVTGAPAIAYPNGGGKWDSDSGTWSDKSDRSLAEWIPIWRDTPIEWVGGCCGVDSKEISQLNSALTGAIGH